MKATKAIIVMENGQGNIEVPIDGLVAAAELRGWTVQGVKTPGRCGLREEISGQPVFRGLSGPMYGGPGVVRYESMKPAKPPRPACGKCGAHEGVQQHQTPQISPMHCASCGREIARDGIAMTDRERGLLDALEDMVLLYNRELAGFAFAGAVERGVAAIRRVNPSFVLPRVR